MTMARCSGCPELREFKQKFGLRMISIAQLIEYRIKRDQLVELVCTKPFPTEYGEFDLHVFRSTLMIAASGADHGLPGLSRRHWSGCTARTCSAIVFHAKGLGSGTCVGGGLA